jgi:hypothetical protein
VTDSALRSIRPRLLAGRDFSPRPRHVVTLVVAATIGLAGAAFGQSVPVPASSVPASAVPANRISAANLAVPATTILPIAALRKRYLAIVDPADAAFAKFSTRLQSLNSAVSSAQLATALDPAASAIARSGRQLYALRNEAPTKIKRAMYQVVLSDNTVWQALEDLKAGWGNRSFNLPGWQSAFAQAVSSANASGKALRKSLGLPVNAS